MVEDATKYAMSYLYVIGYRGQLAFSLVGIPSLSASLPSCRKGEIKEMGDTPRAPAREGKALLGLLHLRRLSEMLVGKMGPLFRDSPLIPSTYSGQALLLLPQGEKEMWRHPISAPQQLRQR